MNRPAHASTGLPHERPASGLLGMAERGHIPDALLRQGIRRLCAQRLREEQAGGLEAQATRFAERIRMLRHSPVAIHTDAANAQHYELPPAFFQLCLGRRLKYSSCYYPKGDESLEQAEDAIKSFLTVFGEKETPLELSALHAKIAYNRAVLKLAYFQDHKGSVRQTGGAFRRLDGHHARPGTRHWRDHGRDDGHGECAGAGDRFGRVVFAGAHHDVHHRRRNG